MASVMQGDAYNIPVTIKSGNGTLITPEIAACVEITVGQFTKRWPGQVTFDEKTGEWQFPVTQKQTFRFAPGAAVVQARVVFQDGSIMGGSGAPVRVEQSASHGTLPQPEKTEAVTGSAPKATEVTIPTVHDIDVALHSQVILSDPIKAPYIGDNGNWYEYDAATGTFVDTGMSASGNPPITPDTAGKYLTNNGSKAEWGEVKESVEVGDAKDGSLLKLSGSDVLNAAIPNVDYALPILYVTITQDGEDSDGNPIYKSDKTYEEIKAAHDRGQEVRIKQVYTTGSFTDNIFGFLGIDYLKITRLYSDGTFQFEGRGIPNPEYGATYDFTGGQPISNPIVRINSEQIRVFLPMDFKTRLWDGMVNKMRQQQDVYVIKRDSGLSSDISYETINDWLSNYLRTVIVYFIPKPGQYASYDPHYLSYCSNGSNRVFVFTRTTSEGLSTIILFQKDGKDVWMHEVVPLGIPPVPVTAADNGKFLRVVDGQWAAEAVANAKGVSF